jgi:hypothetical protein
METPSYLVSDPTFARPLWISEEDLTSNSVGRPD